MAQIAQPQVVINYISQLKKITVNRNNQPSQLIIQTDYNLNETYNFQVINKINQIVELDSNTTYQIYGTYIDAKKQVHILFYTLGVTPRDNMLSFLVNTYTSEYLNYVKSNRTPIDISIVAKQNVGGSTRSYMVLRDSALANPRGYIEGQAPTDIVYQNVFNSQIPVSTAFGAGNNLNLAQDLEGQEIYSFAFGDTLSTNNANQFVIGYNNTPDATKAFIVANSGNIFTVDYEGNVEAGDLNVGAISATSITVSGEDLNQVIDDKVEYLSTSIDDKLSATKDWVSDTFETKESATQTFNELEGDIGQISAFVSGLPTDIAAKADQTDLEALSTTVEDLAQTKADLSAVQAVDNKFANYTPTETIVETYATKTSLEDYAKLSAIPTGNAQLQNTANYITSSQIPTSYVQLSQLDEYAKTAELSAYATSGWVDQNYAKKGEAPTDVYTKAEVNQISTALSSAVSGAGYLTEIPTSYVQKSEIADMATQTWVGQQGFLTEVPNTYATKTDVDNATSAMATTGWVNEQGYLTEVPNTYALKTDIPTDAETYEAISGNIEAQITGKNYITSDALNGLASDEDLQYVSGVVSAQAEDIDALKAVSGEVDYSTVFDMLSSGDPDTLTITKDTTNEKIVLTAAGGGGGGDKTYHGENGIAVDNVNDTISISANFLSANALEGYATQSWVGQQGFALTSQLPTDYTTSAQVSSIIEGYDFATKTEIPTTVAELTDASNYALKSELPSDYTTSAQVSSIVEGYNYITAEGIPNTYALKTDVAEASGAAVNAATGWVDAQAYLKSVPSEYITETELTTELTAYATSSWVDTNYAKKGEAPTDVYTKAEVNAISSALSSAVSEAGYLTEVPNTVSAAAVDAATGWVDSKNYLTEIPNTYALKTDIPTNDEITGLAKDYVDTLNIDTTYATKDELSSKANTADVYSKTVADQTFATKTDISDMATQTWVGQQGFASASDIPTNVSELTNDKNYISAITLSAYNASTMQNEAVQTTTIDLASTDFVTWNGEVYINDNKFDIPTDAEISGIASAVASTYVEGSTISAVGQLINDIGYTTGYTAGTGIDINNGVISCSVQGGTADVNTVYNMLSSANNNLTISLSNNTILFTASGGGGGGSQDLSDYNNDVPFITAEDITNKQRVNTVNGSTITFDQSYEVFKTTYAVSAIVLNPVTVTTSQVGNGEVATFEEWITLTGSGTTTFEVDSNITLIGEWPSEIDNTKTHVLVRRLVNNAGTITQYVSYAYNF